MKKCLYYRLKKITVVIKRPKDNTPFVPLEAENLINNSLTDIASVEEVGAYWLMDLSEVTMEEVIQAINVFIKDDDIGYFSCSSFPDDMFFVSFYTLFDKYNRHLVINKDEKKNNMIVNNDYFETFKHRWKRIEDTGKKKEKKEIGLIFDLENEKEYRLFVDFLGLLFPKMSLTNKIYVANSVKMSEDKEFSFSDLNKIKSE